MAGEKRTCGIIGWPLGHSLSPVLHNWGFKRAGLDYVYEAWPTEPGDVGGFMDRVRKEPLWGVSVTIPHKQAVVEYLDQVSDLARDVGAVNTLYWDGERLCGHNTDVPGFLEGLGDMKIGSALVLGAGGAARAVLAGLRSRGVEEVLLSEPSLEISGPLAREFGAKAVEWEQRGDWEPDLLVNATPLGMLGEHEGKTAWGRERFPRSMVVYDLVYNPQQTRLLREARAAGCRTVDGLTMFLGQAREQFRLWTGLELDVKKGRQVLLEALAGRT